MGSNTKIDGKTINDTKIIHKNKLRPGVTTTRMKEDGTLFEINHDEQIKKLETSKNLFDSEGNIIIPEKRIFTNENDFVKVGDFSEGLRKNKEVDEYNEKLFESRNPLADQIDPLGAKVLIRLFKLHLYNSSGLWTGGRTIQEMSASEMKKINKQADESIQLQDRGVVIKTSDSCVNVSKLTPGTIIDLDPSAFHPGRMSRFIEKTNVNTPFDNYFIVPEFIIDNILKTN